MDINISKQPGNSYKAEVAIDKNEYKEYLDQVKTEAMKEVEADGFRKGNVPEKIAEQKLDPEKIRGTVLNAIFNKTMQRLMTENKFKPIVEPKVELIDFNEEQGAKFNVHIAEMPHIPDFEYKEVIKNLKIESVKDGNATHASDEQLKNTKILEALSDAIEIELSPFLIETEKINMLNNLMNQLNQIDMKLDAYLKETNKTAEEIESEYKETAMRTIKSELILSKIAEKENITIDDAEVNKLLETIPTNENTDIQQTTLYIRSVLQKTKTLEKLRSYLPTILVPNNKIVLPEK